MVAKTEALSIEIKEQTVKYRFNLNLLEEILHKKSLAEVGFATIAVHKRAMISAAKFPKYYCEFFGGSLLNCDLFGWFNIG
jgi:hypothetical protein